MHVLLDLHMQIMLLMKNILDSMTIEEEAIFQED